MNELVRTGDRLLDWATQFQYLEEKQNELYLLATQSTNPKEKADAQLAFLLCLDMLTRLGSPPESKPQKQTPESPEDALPDNTEIQENFGPTLVYQPGPRKVNAPAFENPEVTFGFGTKNSGAHIYEKIFWGSLIARLQGEFVRTFSFNQAALLKNPRKHQFKPFKAREAFKNALELTVVDMSSTKPAKQIEIPDLKGSDLDANCPRKNDIDRERANSYKDYYSMESDYTYICSAFDLSKELYTQQNNNFIFHPDKLENTEKYGTSQDPRLQIMATLSSSDQRHPETE